MILGRVKLNSYEPGVDGTCTVQVCDASKAAHGTKAGKQKKDTPL